MATDLNVGIILQGQDQASGPLGAVQRALAGLGGAATAAGSPVTSLLDTFVRGAVAGGGFLLARDALQAIGSAFDTVTHGASDFTDAMTKVQALTGTSADAVQKLSAQVLTLSTQAPESAKSLADGLYFVVSAGFKGADAMTVLTDSAKAAAAGLGETKTVADAVTSVLNAYHESADKAGIVTDQLTNAVVQGKVAADQLAPSLGRVLPLAASMGVSFDQVTASIASMTRVGLSADEATTALRGTLATLEKPSATATKALADMGLSASQVRQEVKDKGLLATLADLEKRTHGNTDELVKLVPNIRALTGVLATAGSQADVYASILKSQQGALGTTEKAFQTATSTISAQLTLLGNRFAAFGIVVGQAAETPIASFLKTINDALGATGGLDALGKQVGGALGSGIASALRDLQQLVQTGQQIWLVYGRTVQGAMQALRDEIGRTLAPFAVSFQQVAALWQRTAQQDFPKLVSSIVGAIVQLPIAVQPALNTLSDYWRQHGQQVLQYVGQFLDGVGRLVTTVPRAFHDIAQEITSAGNFLLGGVLSALREYFADSGAASLLGQLGAFVQELPRRLAGLPAAMAEQIGQLPTVVGRGLQALVMLWSEHVNTIYRTAGQLADGIRGAWAGLQTTFGTALGYVQQFASGVVELGQTIPRTFVTIVDQINQTLAPLFSGIFGALVDYFAPEGSAPRTGVQSLLTSIRDFVHDAPARLADLPHAIAQALQDLPTQTGAILTGVVTTWNAHVDQINVATNGLITGVRTGWATIQQATETAWTAIGGFFTTRVVPAFELIRETAGSVKDWLVAQWPTIQTVAGAVAAGIQQATATRLVPALTLIRETAGQVKDWLVAHWPDAQKAFEAVATAVQATWTGTLQPMLAALGARLLEVKDWIVQHWPDAQHAWETVASALANAWNTVLKPTLETLGAALIKVREWVVENWPKVQTTWEAVSNAVASAWNTVLKPTVEALGNALITLKKWVDENWPKWQKAITEAWQAVADFWTKTLEPPLRALRDRLIELRDTADKHMLAMQTAITTAWTTINTAASVVSGWLGTLKQNVIDLDTELAKNGAYANLKQAWDDLQKAGGPLLTLLTDFAKDLGLTQNAVVGADGKGGVAGAIQVLTETFRDGAATAPTFIQQMGAFGKILSDVQKIANDAGLTLHRLATGDLNGAMQAFSDYAEQLNDLMEQIRKIDQLSQQGSAARAGAAAGAAGNPAGPLAPGIAGAAGGFFTPTPGSPPLGAPTFGINFGGTGNGPNTPGGGYAAYEHDLQPGSPLGANVPQGEQLFQMIAAYAQQHLGTEGSRVIQAVLRTEAGLSGAVGDNQQSFGPFQFYAGGQLANYAAAIGAQNAPWQQVGEYVRQHPYEAAQWAIDTYLGNTIVRGEEQGLRGHDLATFAQRYGQVSVNPETAGQNFYQLFGYANGGMILNPSVGVDLVTGRPFSIAEHGPERVLSPSQTATYDQRRGGDTHITVYGPNADDIAAQIAREQRRQRILYGAF